MLCLSLLLAIIATPATATISFVDSGRTFSSRQDTEFGQPLLDGYEYMGRLQYIMENPTLCPGIYPNQKFDVVNPADGLPVALFAQSGGCSLMEKIKVASNMINPANVVGYLIVQDDRTGRHHHQMLSLQDTAKNMLAENESKSENENENKIQNLFMDQTLQRQHSLENGHNQILDHDKKDSSILLPPEFLKIHLESAEQNGRALLELPNLVDPFDDTQHLQTGLNGDASIAILHVSLDTGYALQETLVRQDPMDRFKGGPRVLLNAKGNNVGPRTLVFWMLVTFSMCACGCACLIMCVQTGFEDEPEPQAPRRPARRRLTLEEVRARFPSYHFSADDHTQCCPSDGACEEAAQQHGYMELSDECTICLDEFVHGVRVRKLPCGHVFHSTCIARWLIERSAVCPLCKMDLYIDPEEEDESSSESDTGHPEPPAPFWNNWFTAPNAAAGYTQLEVPTGAAESAPLLDDNGGEEPRSWWPFSVEIVSNDEEEEEENGRRTRSPFSAARNAFTTWTRSVLGRRQASNEMPNLTELTEPLVTSSSSMEETTITSSSSAAAVSPPPPQQQLVQQQSMLVEATNTNVSTESSTAAEI